MDAGNRLSKSMLRVLGDYKPLNQGEKPRSVKLELRRLAPVVEVRRDGGPSGSSVSRLLAKTFSVDRARALSFAVTDRVAIVRPTRHSENRNSPRRSVVKPICRFRFVTHLRGSQVKHAIIAS